MRRGGVGVLRREPVVDGHHRHAGLARQVGGQAHRGRGRPDGEEPAVEVHDDAVGGGAGDVDVDDRHAAQLPGGGGDVGGHRGGGDHLVEHRPLLAQVTRRVER